jgi:hypothetical protein
VRRRATEDVGTRSERIDESIDAIGRVFSLVEEVVQKKVGVAVPTRRVLGSIIAIVDHDIEMPVALLTV